MLGDRRTFMGETSIRVLERRLGIQRDQTLTYQTSYRRNQFASGYYNDYAVRGGYDYNPNSGVPVKRTPEIPAYQLGRQSYQQHKRVKTGNEEYDYTMQTYHSASSYGLPYGAPPMPPASGMRYPPSAGMPPSGGMPPYPNANPPNMMPLRNPNEMVSLRPPPPTQYANFDRNDRGQGRNSIQERREGKRDPRDNRDNRDSRDNRGNRFSGLGGN